MANKKDDASNNLAIGMALGLTFGAVASLVTGNWGLIGAGICVGVALGLGVNFSSKTKRKKEK